MKILITGGTVFVSKSFAQYFVSHNCEVYVLNRNTRPQVEGVHLIECDRRAVGDKLKDKFFDAVIDVNAYTAEDVNALLDSVGGFGQYILISSSAVYPQTLQQPFKESDECGANIFWGNYGLNKIAAESALAERVSEAYIIRPPYLYGELNNVYREAFVFDCAQRDRVFYLPGEGQMPLQFFYIGDLCRFVDIILKVRPRQKIFNVGNAPVTVREWVTACYAAVGKEVKFFNVSEIYEQRSYFPFYNYGYVLDTTLQNSIMPSLTPLAEGLRRAYEWYRCNRGDVKPKDYIKFIDENLKGRV